jgi:hypothetical protein
MGKIDDILKKYDCQLSDDAGATTKPGSSISTTRRGLRKK